MSGNRCVAVTGATGFIGRVLCGKLLDMGHEVVAMVRTPCSGPWTSSVRIALGQDSVDPALLEGVDTVFHLAGKAHVRARSVAEIQEYEDVHVRGTRSLLLAARAAGVRAFVLLGSVKAMGAATYGTKPRPARREIHTDAPSSRPKGLFWRMCLLRVPWLCVRPWSTAGGARVIWIF